MDYQQALILAIVQGMTEWLPISSSGHLAIIQQLFNLQTPVSFDVILHFGTFLAVSLFMRKELLAISKAILKQDFKSKEAKLAFYLLIATIPVGVVGVLLKKPVEALFNNMPAVTAGLAFTGVLLFASERQEKPGKLDTKKSLAVGIMQAVSIIPGISRSGTTISTGLISGVNKEDAARFSFLLSIPAVLGAVAVDAKDLMNSDISLSITVLATAVSAVVGYLSLKLLWKTILERRFHLFAYYCWALALTLVSIQIL